MLKLVVLVALVAAANGASCPAVCSTCFAGGAGGGTSLVGGVCHASCSTSRYCGTSDAYTNGGTDCTGCAETPTAAQRANLKLADAHFVTNTKASITAAESLYKQTVVEFSALFNAGSLLTKSAKMRYNYLLDLDSRKPAAEQALLCVDNCSPTGTWVPPANDPLGCPAGGIYAGMNYCTWASGVGSGSNPYSLCGQTHMDGGGGKCQKTCGTCADKTPYAASELSSLLGRRSNDQCSDGVQNGDETGVDCGGSCSVCPVDCVFSETTCTCTSACDKTCDCTDTITITTPAAGRGQACPSATVRTFAGAACPPPAYSQSNYPNGYDLTAAQISTMTCSWTKNQGTAQVTMTSYGFKVNSLCGAGSGCASASGSNPILQCEIDLGFSFTGASASYTIVPLDDNNAIQHPDDSQTMTSWGMSTTEHEGYFSFGTPATIINGGGSAEGKVGWSLEYRGGAWPISFTKGPTAASTVLRFGFCQSYYAEQFRIKDIAAKIWFP